MTQPIISFKNFTFKYDSQAFPTLKNINLDIKKTNDTLKNIKIPDNPVYINFYNLI